MSDLDPAANFEAWGSLVSTHFPRRAEDVEQQDWGAVKTQLPVGQTVRGVVVARAPFGAWLDIGVAFPALLLIPEIAGLTPERYRAGDWCPVGGTEEATIVGFHDRNHQIGVTQTRRWPTDERRSPGGILPEIPLRR